MALKKWQDVIYLDFPDIPDNISGFFTNKDLEERRKRLDRLSLLEERRYQKSLHPREHPITRTSRYLHYSYTVYELTKWFLN